MEGAHCFARAGCATDGLTLPIAEYGHDLGCSVTGGYVYRGEAIADLHGWYLFGDYCSGHPLRHPGRRRAARRPRASLLETGLASAPSATDPTASSTWSTSAAASSPDRRRRRLTERAERAQARPSAAPDDQVVEQLDVEQAPGLRQLGGDAQVLARRAGSPRDGCGPR